MSKNRIRQKHNKKLYSNLSKEIERNGSYDFGFGDPVSLSVMKRFAAKGRDNILMPKHTITIENKKEDESDLFDSMVNSLITRYHDEQVKAKLELPIMITLPCGKLVNRSIGQCCSTECPNKKPGTIKKCYNLKKYGANQKDVIKTIQELRNVPITSDLPEDLPSFFPMKEITNRKILPISEKVLYKLVPNLDFAFQKENEWMIAKAGLEEWIKNQISIGKSA